MSPSYLVIGEEGGLPPIVQVGFWWRRFGLYVVARGRRFTCGPAFGWRWERWP